MLTREAILGYKDDRIGKVDVPEMGGEVCVASLTAAEADQITKLGDGAPASVGLVILAACDDDGKRLFTDKDIPALSKLPASVMGKIANAVLAHNGLAGDSAAEAKNDSSET